MNVLQVQLAPDHPFGGFGVRLLIDGRDLVDLVRDYERAFAGDLAGSYGLLPAADTLPPAGHFLGVSEPYYSGESGRTLLLACECGEPGCWPLEASIRTDDRTVTWTEFKQPHRPQWSYDGFGPFVFDRAAYEVALAKAAAGHQSM
jgi:hypothetical protein